LLERGKSHVDCGWPGRELRQRLLDHGKHRLGQQFVRSKVASAGHEGRALGVVEVGRHRTSHDNCRDYRLGSIDVKRVQRSLACG
jgi:hypothetical protein